MTKFSKKALTVFSFITLVVSCDRPVCKNTNQIFDKYSPASKEYKDELVKQLAKVDKSKLTYWMDSYQENNNAQYLYALIQGDGICAKFVLTVSGAVKGIEEILKAKGMGYNGADLKDLKFEIKQESAAAEFVFQEISGIVD